MNNINDGQDKNRDSIGERTVIDNSQQSIDPDNRGYEKN